MARVSAKAGEDCSGDDVGEPEALLLEGPCMFEDHVGGQDAAASEGGQGAGVRSVPFRLTGLGADANDSEAPQVPEEPLEAQAAGPILPAVVNRDANHRHCRQPEVADRRRQLQPSRWSLVVPVQPLLPGKQKGSHRCPGPVLRGCVDQDGCKHVEAVGHCLIDVRDPVGRS